MLFKGKNKSTQAKLKKHVFYYIKGVVIKPWTLKLLDTKTY